MKYEDMVVVYYNDMKKAAQRLSYQDWDDILQNTVIRIMSRQSPLTSLKNPRGFCISQVYRCMLDMRRAERRKRNGQSVVSMTELNHIDPDTEDSSQEADIPQPPNQEDSYHLSLVIRQVLSLPKRQKQCVLLYVFAGLTQQQIADKLGMTQAHVSSALVGTKHRPGAFSNLSPNHTITMKDIALAANVSVSAVSMALGRSKDAGLKESTKQRILSMAQSLNYQGDRA